MTIETFVFFDIETTGLPQFEKNKTKITELTFIAVARKDIETTDAPHMNKLSLLFDPERKIQRGASKLTGLTNGNLKNQPIFKNRIQTIKTFLLELSPPVCLVAHNGNKFDFKILKAEFCQAGQDLPPHVLCVDSLPAFRNFMKDKTNIIIPLSPSKYITPETNITSTINEDDLLTDDEDDWPQLNTSAEEWNKIDDLSLNEYTTNKPKRREKISYRITALYERFLKKKEEIRISHRAEADCIMLLECVATTKEYFLPWADKNCKYISEIKPLVHL